MLRSASPPDQLMAIRFYNFLMNNEIYKLFHNSLSMLTGNYSEMVNSIIYVFFSPSNDPMMRALGKLFFKGNEISSNLQYSFNSFFDGCSYENYQPLTYDSFIDFLNASDVTAVKLADMPDDFANNMNIVLSALELGGVTGSELSFLGYTGTIIGLSDDALNEVVLSYNQFAILQSINKQEALDRVQVYKQTGDLKMIACATCIEKLINASPSEQAAFLCKKTTLGFGEDVANAALSIIASKALDSAVPGSGQIVGITGAVADNAFNAASFPELANNLKHSVDTTNKIYIVYENALKNYEMNPSEENLNKAINSYQAYQQACADSTQVLGNLVEAASSSKVGKFIPSNALSENISRQAATYRKNSEKIKNYTI